MLDTTTEIHEQTTVPLAPDGFEQMDGDALRQRVRDYAAAHAVSLKSIGTLCGVAGESTFSAWVSGKYKGDNDGVEKKVRIWLRNEDQVSRQRAILPADIKFAQTPTAVKFLTALEYAQALPDIVVISGGSGVSKTSAVEHYAETRPNVWLLTAEPLLSSHSKMMEYLREQLGIPETGRHKVSRAVAQKLRGTRGLIILDEAQHLTPKCLDQMRSVYDRAHIGLAIVGNEDVWGRIDGGGNSKYAQVFSRVGMRVTVARPTAKDIDVLLDTAGVTGVKNRAILKTIGQMPGGLRGIVKTLRAAQTAAGGAKQELSEEHLTWAWNRRTGRQDGGL
jgi:DNA transposition AAA+ family ATPase